MDYLYAFLGGAVCKIYDDFNDNKIITNQVALESIKGLQWTTLALLSYNDFNFTIFNYIINFGNALVNWKEWNHPYETSLLIVYPFFLLTSYSTRAYITFYDLLCIIYIFTCFVTEPSFITEEYSYRKLFIRISCILLCIIALILNNHLPVSLFMQKTLYFGIGYHLVSSCFQAYMLFK